MKPLELTMQAFGSFGAKTMVDFTAPAQTLFLVTGDTGAGKTTIFDAIVFALYGETGSSGNKKEGTVLQSQYAAYGTEPYVQLTFSDGADGEVYCVRRVPRHYKLLTRGAAKGVGTREITGSVSLTMPDGTEYPAKETDGKIQEIVGLTKSQFMQVAMIAQGEFMDLLRASSDTRKVVFRKLFHTELYEKIVRELEERKRKKWGELEAIRNACKTIAARVRIPQDYGRYQEISGLKARIADGILGDLEKFSEELQLLIEKLCEDEKSAEAAHKAAEKERDARRDAVTEAQNLLKFYEQLEQAEREEKECSDAAPGIAEMERLMAGLKAAFEILVEYEKYETAAKDAENIREEKERLEKEMPQLAETARDLAGTEQKEKENYEHAQADYSKLAERVETARRTFEQIEELTAEYQENERQLRSAEEQEENLRNCLQELKEKEAACRRQAQELGDAQALLEGWKGKEKEADRLMEVSGETKKLERQIEKLRANTQRSKEEYNAAKMLYEKKNQEYEHIRRLFLDAQAGMLARDLEPGQPCPVCGSTEHPAPYRWTEELADAADLSREQLEVFAQEVQELRERQEQAAAQANKNETLLEEKNVSLKEAKERLEADYRAAASDIQERAAGESIHEEISGWKKKVQAEGKILRGNAETCQRLSDTLSDIGKNAEQLRESLEVTREAANQARLAAGKVQAELSGLSKTTGFASSEEAEAALEAEDKRLQSVRDAYEHIGEKRAAAKTEKERAEALLHKYEQELPGKETEAESREAAYHAIMEQQDLSETEWKELTSSYDKSKIDELQKSIQAHSVKKQKAAAVKAAAEEAIGDSPKPELEALKQEMHKTQEHWTKTGEILETCKSEHKAAVEVYEELAARQKVSGEALEAHARLEELYRKASGNISGGRMDLETYVQRYYMEQILYDANRRFSEMSAGQFELRMIKPEKAGEGRNRGLDLMVYSTVTGREREIRTLSGGESFMAALSLALGMADQIQEHSAAIHLDIMFVDEGFGSLDEQSRHQAVRVLKEMAEGSRLIGIISHVTELKQEIGDQLLVTKDDGGSHVRWNNFT